MMKAIQFPHLRSALLQRGFALLLLVGIVALSAQCRKESEMDSPSPAERSSYSQRNDAPGDVPTKPSGRSRRVEQSTDLSADDLVAIHERNGAAAALDAAKALTGSRRGSQVSFILAYLARIDPEFVANELRNAGLDATLHGFVVDAVLLEWKDGENALAWADTQLTGETRMRAVATALGILVRTDPQAALAYLDTMPESNSRRQAISSLFGAWGRHDPQAALWNAAQLPADEVASATRQVLRSWLRDHPEEVAAWLESYDSPSPSLLRDLYLAWPEHAETSAQEWFDSLPESAAKLEAKAGIEQMKSAPMTITIVCGPATAPNESWKTKQVSEMTDQDLRNWAYQDKPGARRFLEQAPDNPDLREMVIAAAASMASDEGPEAAFDWALQLEPGLRAAALRLAVSSWSRKDPAAAAEKIATIPADHREPLALALAENWSRQDPAAGAAWVANSHEPNQPALVVKVIEQWAGMEPDKAYGWLGTLPAGAARDEGISLMIRREARHDPESLLPWVDQISQPEMQREMSAFLQGWLDHPDR